MIIAERVRGKGDSTGHTHTRSYKSLGMATHSCSRVEAEGVWVLGCGVYTSSNSEIRRIKGHYPHLST